MNISSSSSKSEEEYLSNRNNNVPPFLSTHLFELLNLPALTTQVNPINQ